MIFAFTVFLLSAFEYWKMSYSYTSTRKTCNYWNNGKYFVAFYWQTKSHWKISGKKTLLNIPNLLYARLYRTYFYFSQIESSFNDNKRHIITIIIHITEITTVYLYALGYYICNFYKTYLISTKVKTLIKLGYVNKSIFQKTILQNIPYYCVFGHLFFSSLQYQMSIS